jgi:hypothetical protein
VKSGVGVAAISSDPMLAMTSHMSFDIEATTC